MQYDQGAFEKTVVKPIPGGTHNRGQKNNTQSYEDFTSQQNLLDSLAITYAENPLVSAASTLIYSIVSLRHMDINHNPQKLRENLIQAIKNFDQFFYQAKLNTKLLLPSRYVLCTVIDEFVMLSQWGQQSEWNKNSMLSLFHKEVWGGEKIFTILDKLRSDVSQNLFLLELIFICLNLGFEGKYRVLNDGKSQLLELQNSLYQQIRQQRGGFDKELSPSWRGVNNQGDISANRIPLWVVGAITGVVMLSVYSIFSLLLSSHSDTIVETIDSELMQEQEQLQVINQ